ncbi:MAG: flagellar hook-basal body protein [Candidatus Krumholzibacteriota bacterium]|nr:flagellar hook-basal body protein [Candidatus Krumholzibacteriota bacterium]
MIKALEHSGQAMGVQLRRHEIIANNLANLNTPGFQRVIARVSDAAPIGAAAAARTRPALRVESLTSGASGPLQATGNPLDAALVGEGYFLVETPRGERLSRDGSFALDAAGTLLHSSGHPVLADGGALSIRGSASILADGSVLDDGRLVGRLTVVRPAADAGLEREGDNLLRVAGEIETVPAGETSVLGGHLEGANVQAVQEMVDMIRAFRAYEIAQRAALAADDTLRIATERVGVVRA